MYVGAIIEVIDVFDVIGVFASIEVNGRSSAGT